MNRLVKPGKSPCLHYSLPSVIACVASITDAALPRKTAGALPAVFGESARTMLLVAARWRYSPLYGHRDGDLNRRF